MRVRSGLQKASVVPNIKERPRSPPICSLLAEIRLQRSSLELRMLLVAPEGDVA